MKHITALLVVTHLLCASIAFPQAVNNTLKNFKVSGGTYTMEIWTQWKSGTVHLSHGEFAILNWGRRDDLGSPTVTFEPRYGGQVVWAGIVSFAPNAPNPPTTYSWIYDFTSVIPASSGEKVCTISFPIQTPSATASISWGTVYNGHGYTGFQGVVNNNSGTDNELLPIQLASFKATRLTGNGVALSWTTASETRNYGFYVQRDGVDITFIAGLGTSATGKTYTCTDNPGPGQYRYGLKQVDLDGTATLSETILVDVTSPATFALSQSYPNPCNPSARIAFTIAKEGPVSLRVYDILGREVATLVNENRKPGQYTETFNGGQQASGAYVYVLKSSEGQLKGRMMLLK